MDTLDKILKTHKIPLFLRLKKGEFELVIVTKYPHGYDVSEGHICDSLDGAFLKAVNNPLSLSETPYAWRIYGFGQVKIAQSPNLHLWLPDNATRLQDQMTERIEALELVGKAQNDFLVETARLHPEFGQVTGGQNVIDATRQYIQHLEHKSNELEGKLNAMELDRDDWRDSCKLANKRIDTTAHAEKENHRLRKMLQAIVDYSTPMELRRLIGESAKLLKDIVKHG